MTSQDLLTASNSWRRYALLRHTSKRRPIFFNTEQLKQLVSTAESKRNDITGHAYFKTINASIEQHVHVGELYLEYIKGDCQQNSGVLCEFCTKFPPSRDSLHRLPRPKPDETVYQIWDIYHLTKLQSLHQRTFHRDGWLSTYGSD